MTDERRMDNLSMRIWMETLENVVGSGGLRSILHYGHLEKYIDTFPPDNDNLEIPIEDSRKLLIALLELFGQKGTRALQLRAGREFVRIGVEKTGAMAKALQVASRLMSEPKRMRLALEKFSEESEKRLISEYSPRIEIIEEEDCFLFIDKDNMESQGVDAQAPVCGVLTGLLSELMEWITGHPHEVQEIQCRAAGHSADVFRIWKARRE